MDDPVSGDPPVSELDSWKRLAARDAVAAIPDGAVVGLGTGSTADFMLQELAARVRGGLRVTGVATSDRTAARAQALGIPLADLNDRTHVSLSIDGADEITLPHLNLIKGRGGALLKEKLVASASAFRIIIADETKIVHTLGMNSDVPVEVVPFGWKMTAQRLVEADCRPTLRTVVAPDLSTRPFITDCGNFILDCRCEALDHPEDMASRLKAIVGVVEHGLFIGMTDRVYIGGPSIVHVFNRPA